MSKTVAIKDLGVPVPADLTLVLALVCYYGTRGFTPSYPQTARIVFPVASLKTTTANGASVYDVPVATALPTGVPDGAYDFYFTFSDTADGVGSESDFSPVISETIDRSVPPTPGQPVTLG